MSSPKLGNIKRPKSLPAKKLEPKLESVFLRKQLLELESEFETAARLASDPLKLIEHLLDSSQASSSKAPSKAKKQRIAEAASLEELLSNGASMSVPEKSPPVLNQDDLTPTRLKESSNSLSSPKRARSSPILSKDLSKSALNFNTEKQSTQSEHSDVRSLPSDFISPVAGTPMIHQGLFESLKAEHQKKESQAQKLNPTLKTASSQKDLTDADDQIATDNFDDDHNPLALRTLSLFSSPQQMCEELKEVNPASVQAEVLKHINDHHGTQRPFNFREISRRVSTFPLAPHIKAAHKPLSLEEWRIHTLDLETAKLNEKVEKLISQNAWSYRQERRQPVPQRPLSHWDRVLEEMHWLQTDFIEEKKWKVYMAAHIAHSVVNWHQSTNRRALCTRAYFRRNGTVNPNWVDPFATKMTSLFDVGPYYSVVDGHVQAYKDLPVHAFEINDKSHYHDTLDRGPLVPITRLMETFIHFRPGTYSSTGNLSLGVDFQNYTTQSRTKRKSPGDEKDWLEAEDMFIRKQSPELAFNWGLIAELLNSTSSFAEHKRTAQECSARWSFVSSNVFEAKEAPDVPKESPSTPRFQIFDKAKAQALSMREQQASQVDPKTPEDLPTEDKKYLTVIEIIQSKMEEEEALRKRLEPREEAATLAQSTPPKASATQTPLALPRLAPAPGHPPMLLARPGLYPTLQALNFMRNGLGNVLNMVRPSQEQMGSTTMPPGARPFSPNVNLGPFSTAGATNARMLYSMAPLRPGTPISNIDFNTPDGRMVAAQISTHRDLLAQRMMQIHQNNMRNNQAAAQHPMHLNDNHYLVEQQRQLVRQIQESGAILGNYPMPSSSMPAAPQVQGQQIRPRLPTNGNSFSNNLSQAASTSAMSPQSAPGPITSYLQPPPEPIKPAKRARAPKKTPARKRAQKPATSEPTPQPLVSSTVATPSPHAPSPHPIQFMPFSSTPTQQPTAQPRFPNSSNISTQHLNLGNHLMIPHAHLQQRAILPTGSSLMFMPPQVGPTAPIRPPAPNQHISVHPNTSVGQAPDCRQD
ncbi:chromatin modification- protein VID21 [Entomophthora muscae]|uniref:Chromatin modification- protein VID21 n=1 Tax=Entomophthora muscae TaxID=34485 RepID=A0ACC2RW36_9FUNG|nr:chromatin modification- protein VID21 [Entomophthora muscae]